MGEVRKVTLEAIEVLGQWRARIYAVSQDEEGTYEEPYVLTAEFSTLDLAGIGWQAMCVLDEACKHLNAALRDGYE